jgi:phosphatidylglycerophosphate synthase
LFSLLPAFGAGVALGYGWFGLGAVLATIAQFADIVDGLLARRLGMVSDVGKVLDSAVDRYVELFFLGGLAVHYRSSGMLIVVLAAIAAAFMVSYSTAKAEAIGVKPPRGAMRHAERGMYLLVGAALTPFATAWAGEGTSLLARELPIIAALFLVAIVGNLSVVRRFAAVVTFLINRQPRPGQPTPAADPHPHPLVESDTSVGAV